MKQRDRIGNILEFWFGELDADGMASGEKGELWFRSSESLDNEIRRRFGTDVALALAGSLDNWSRRDDGLIALTLLLDQFTRNIDRGSPAAFRGDEAALRLVRAAVGAGRDRVLPTIHRVFLYIPFEHAEDLAAQDEGLACFDRLLADCPAPTRDRVSGFRRYAQAHRDVIARFGRFPHRNKLLGRTSTDAELEHLQNHGGF